MANSRKRTSVWAEVEPYCVIRRLWKNLWMILMSAALFALVAYIAATLLMKPSYTCSATFVVTPKYASSGSSTTVANGAADQFASILSSSTITKRVQRERGSSVAGAAVSASSVKNTSLIQMNVSAPTPSAAFYMATGIMDHYEEYSKYVFDSLILETVSSPAVPDRMAFAARQKKVVLIGGALGALGMAVLLAVLAIVSGTVQTTVGARNQVDGNLIVTLNHQRKHRTLKSRLTRKKTSLLISDPTTAFLYVETVHQLRARVEHAKRHHHCKTFLLTSVTENEGKSTVAANLALSLAKKSKRVLLIDCDLRKSAQHLIFEAKPDRSKTLNALLKEDLDPNTLVKALQYRKADNLFCLFASNVKKNSTELLGSVQMKRLLKVLRENFDYVILDTPPMGFFTDSEVLAEQADASVLVIRQDTVRDLAVNDAIDSLKRCSARFLGYVFNDVHNLNFMARVMGGGHRYGYGYGYGYGHGYGYGYGYSKRYGYGYGNGKAASDAEEDVSGIQEQDGEKED